MEWEDSVKGVYLICNPEKEPLKYRRIVPHILMRGIPKSHLKLACPVWEDSLKCETIFNAYNPFLNRGNLPTFNYKGYSLLKSEISLNINFYNIIRHAMTDLSNNDSILVLESNAYLRYDFSQRLSKIILDLSGTEWDYISLNGGTEILSNGLYTPTTLQKPPVQWVARPHDSMLLSKRFIDKLYKTFLPFKECLSWELNFQILFHKSIVLWANPPLTESGSHHSRNVNL